MYEIFEVYPSPMRDTPITTQEFEDCGYMGVQAIMGRIMPGMLICHYISNIFINKTFAILDSEMQAFHYKCFDDLGPKRKTPACGFGKDFDIEKSNICVLVEVCAQYA